MLLHLQIFNVNFLHSWSYITSLCWCRQTHLSSCYLLTSFVPFKLLWNLKCDFLWKFLFRKAQQRALCVCFLQLSNKNVSVKRWTKCKIFVANFKLGKIATVLIYAKIYVETFLCTRLLSIQTWSPAQQQPAPWCIRTTICWHNAFKSKSQHPALV